MDVKEAVSVAKSYVKDVFADEDISNFGLDEVEYDDRSNVWYITIGFSRPWNSPRSVPSQAPFLGALSPRLNEMTAQPRKRSFKIVSVNDKGKVLSLKNRPREDGAE